MDNATHTMLAITWFGLIGLMLVFYVVTDDAATVDAASFVRSNP
jgi:hypothetical protein